MKKSILVFGSVLSLFILVSLSYQPIIAEKEVIEIKEEVEIVEEEDCGCDKEYTEFIDWDFPIICRILRAIAIFGIFLTMTIGITIIGAIAFFLGNVFNCSWTE